MISPRGVYTHHGIYVGSGSIVHYSGLADSIATGPVEEVGLTTFCAGRDFYIKAHAAPAFNTEQITRRARSRIGESAYSVFANNCEHFCNWCIEGDHDSAQVTSATTVASPSAGTVAGLIARGVVSTGGAVAGLSGPGVMSGLATAGSLVGGGAVAGLGVLAAGPSLAMASLVNSTVLKDDPVLEQHERDSRSVGRAASYTGAVAGTAGSIAAVSAVGSVAGLSGAGITSGLAAIGSVAGGGMAAGVVITTALPVAAAAGLGYGVYKLVKWVRS